MILQDTRLFFTWTFGRVCTPFREVTFADFLLADCLTSLSKALSDTERAICHMSTGEIMRPNTTEAVRFLLCKLERETLLNSTTLSLQYNEIIIEGKWCTTMNLWGEIYALGERGLVVQWRACLSKFADPLLFSKSHSKQTDYQHALNIECLQIQDIACVQIAWMLRL